ncbi:hypothetical protein ACFPRL_33510 [Pseudoclavibacter helvolus]
MNQTSMRSKSCSTSPTPSPWITAATPRSTAMSICGPGPWVSVAGRRLRLRVVRLRPRERGQEGCLCRA